MELSRLIRLARARWWLFAIIAGIGLVAGVVLTQLRNDRIEPQFEAFANVLFTFENDDDRQRGLQGLVASAEEQAEEANADLLGPLALIRVDPEDNGALQFIGRAREAETAEATASELRENYLSFASDQLQGQENASVAELAALDVQLARIEADLNEIDQLLAVDTSNEDSERALLAADLAALEAERRQLLLEKILGPDNPPQATEIRTIEDVDADLVVIEDAIQGFRELIAGIPEAPPEQLNESTRRRAILTDQYAQLLDRYTEIIVSPDVPVPFTIGRSDVLDNTPQPSSPVLNGLLGLLLGAAAALGIVIVADRVRRSVWAGSDLTTVPLLGEIPARGPLRVAGQLWYELGGPPQRKRAVQAMRVTIESGVGGSRSVLGFSGIGAPALDVHSLAADFAMSLVTSGNRVLLVDADFAAPSDLAEFDGQGPTFSEVLQHRMDDEESFRSFVKRSITEPAEIRPGLVSMRVGEGLSDPADALASRRLSIMLQEARGIFDMTVIVTGEARDTTSQTVLNRTDNVIFCIRPGRAGATTVESLHAQLNTFGVGVMGAALVLRAGSGDDPMPVGPEAEPPSPRRSSRVDEDPADALVEALVKERERNGSGNGDRPGGRSEPSRPVQSAPRVEALPAPDSGGTAPTAGAPVALPAEVHPLPSEPSPVAHAQAAPAIQPIGDAEPFGPITTHTGDALPLIASLSPATIPEPSEQVAALIETTILHVLKGFSGAAGTQRFDPGIRDVTKYGFIPLVRVKGHKTLGARVLESLRENLDDDGKRQLQAELIEFFDIDAGGRANERIAGAINRWTADHFFTRHLAATGREPEVWHVGSPNGAFHALIHSNRCTKERIDLLRSEILRRLLETLNKSLKTETKAKRANQVRRLEEQIKDVRTFDISLGWLFEGTTPNSRIWYPWKSPEQQPQGWDPNFDEGIRANIAPLQRLGLLLQDVLTEEELLALSPPS